MKWARLHVAKARSNVSSSPDRECTQWSINKNGWLKVDFHKYAKGFDLFDGKETDFTYSFKLNGLPLRVVIR